MLDSRFAKVKDSLRIQKGITNLNILVVVNCLYEADLPAKQRATAYKEQFYHVAGLDKACIDKVNGYLTSSNKKLFVNGLDAALKERAEKLKEYLDGCKVETLTEIVIHYQRKGRNDYRTWGTYTILGTDFTGYILERPKGDNPSTLESFKRHPAGTFNIGYSENSGGSAKFNDVTLYIQENPAYKLHIGNRADQSDGCLLINEKSPELDKYPDAFQSYEKDVNKKAKDREDNPDRASVANSYYEHSNPVNPAYKLRNKVKELEDEIKLKLKLETIVKKIFIDESLEKIK